MLRTSIVSLILLCWFAPAAQEVCSSSYDGNDDGQVGITDLLGLLTVFGDMDLDDDGIWDSQDDCIDLNACNYNFNPTEPCNYIDACGICGGLGAIYECGCYDIPDGDCDCEGNELDAIGVCGGTCELDANHNGVCDDVEGCSDPAACNYQEGNIDPFTSFVGPCLQLDTHKVHIDGPLAGMVTYRMYFHNPSEDDYIVGIGGSSGNSGLDPVYILPTSGEFYQHPLGSHIATGVYVSLFELYPELEFDSWVTISYAPEQGIAEQPINTAVDPNQNSWIDEFEDGFGLIFDTSVGGGWYIVPSFSGTMGFPDGEGRVLIGQFTTAGLIDAQVSVARNSSSGGDHYWWSVEDGSCVQSDLCDYPDADGNCD
jgi:hypothetical protein